MFTGIVQAIGVVQSIERGGASNRLTLHAPDLPRPIPHGGSICVSGVCLTVTSADEQTVTFEVIPETLARSTLGGLVPGERVNLEPSLRVGDRLDGHMVQGHVDGTAVVQMISSDRGGYLVTFEAGPELMPYIIPKGSIAIDGVSLTIAAVEAGRFSVALIPTTLGVTTLGSLRIGSRVNIETDIFARTVIATLQRWQAGGHASGMPGGKDARPPGAGSPDTRRSGGGYQDARPPGEATTIEMLRENGW